MTEDHIGERVRSIRKDRGITVETLAGLVGISKGQLSKLERGLASIDSRRLCHRLADALHVPVSEITADLNAPAEYRAEVTLLADALAGWTLGETPEVPVRPWPAVLADSHHLHGNLRPGCAYGAELEMLPGLILELLALSNGGPHRAEALEHLIQALDVAGALGGRLGHVGLPVLAVERMRAAADELGDPDWIAAVAWVRAQALSSASRARQRDLAITLTDSAPSGRPEIRGMAHLTAAMASAALSDPDGAWDHLAEAEILAQSIEADVSPWPLSMMVFGRTNVHIWRVSIGVELGEGPKVAERARGVDVTPIGATRQCVWWTDIGRGLLADPRYEGDGLRALLRAEAISPQQVRNNKFVRELVAARIRSARRSAGGSELLGLAHRIGVE